MQALDENTIDYKSLRERERERERFHHALGECHTFGRPLIIGAHVVKNNSSHNVNCMQISIFCKTFKRIAANKAFSSTSIIHAWIISSQSRTRVF